MPLLLLYHPHTAGRNSPSFEHLITSVKESIYVLMADTIQLYSMFISQLYLSVASLTNEMIEVIQDDARLFVAKGSIDFPVSRGRMGCMLRYNDATFDVFGKVTYKRACCWLQMSL
jgi:hypothetical protein